MALRRLFLLAVVAFASGSALAQDASGCAKFKWSVERERSAFGAPDLRVVEPGGSRPGIMAPATVRLKPVADAGFVRPPGHRPKDRTFGGVVKAPPIAAAGTYQITLSDDAWIDVIQGGREVRSSASSGERDCPDVRKSVRFPLKADDATVQISGSPTDSIKVDILPTD